LEDEVTVFLIWIGITGLGLVLYSLALWKKNKKQSRFQAKLTILFLFFILMPTIPLTLFVADVLTQSADILLLPGIGKALETSLATIRDQVEEKGRLFFSEHPDPYVWDIHALRKKEIHMAGFYQLIRDSVSTVRVVHLPACSIPRTWLPNRDLFKEIPELSQTSYLILSGDLEMISVHRRYPPASLGVVVYPVPVSVRHAKSEITHALSVYNTLSLLKETIIKRNIIWAVASLITIILVLLAVTTAKKISRGISEPIQDLVQGMHRVASGDFSHEVHGVHSRANDEIRFLVDSFNAMILDLRTTRQQLVEAEKRAAWQEAARRISHEIRNSLTPLFISLRKIKTLGQSVPFPQQLAENLAVVEEELVSLERISSAFSEFAQMPHPQKNRLNLNDSVQAAVRIAENDRGTVRLKTELYPHPLYLEADREQMKRMLHNLIKNAVEASPENGTVTIRSKLGTGTKSTATVEIEDCGDGMDPATVGKLFQPYFTTKKKGTGLGLVIAKKIAEDHNGEIAIQSEKGRGTVIRIVFK
jgi:nitrogen fixation/metabolism regulation signal transduction histidine kinase